MLKIAFPGVMGIYPNRKIMQLLRLGQPVNLYAYQTYAVNVILPASFARRLGRFSVVLPEPFDFVMPVQIGIWGSF